LAVGSRQGAGRSFGRSLSWALSGVRRTYANEPNFRRELVIGALAVALALWLRAPLAPILIMCGLVLSLELLNSALEAAVDLVSPQQHDLAATAKDAAAGAVLVAAVAAVAVGLAVLGPPLWQRLFG
jgi:diacylglycerol kinase (ATP)